MGSVVFEKRVSSMDADLDAVLCEPFDSLTTAEKTSFLYRLETFTRRLDAARNHFLAAMAQVPAEELGEPSVAAALSTLLRISTEEANRRIKEAKDLGPRVAMTGEPLEPVLSHTAAAQERGLIGAEHVTIIRKFFTKLPGFVDHDTREAAEAQLAELACGLRPEDLRAAADRLAATLDQDGELSEGIGPGGVSSPWGSNSATGRRGARPARSRDAGPVGRGVGQVGRTRDV